MSSSYAFYVKLPNEAPCTNALRFATRAEAEAYGSELLSRWTAPDIGFANETADPVTHRWIAGAGAVRIETLAAESAALEHYRATHAAALPDVYA